MTNETTPFGVTTNRHSLSRTDPTGWSPGGLFLGPHEISVKAIPPGIIGKDMTKDIPGNRAPRQPS